MGDRAPIILPNVVVVMFTVARPAALGSQAPRPGGSADEKTEAIAACKELKQLAVPKGHTSLDHAGLITSISPPFGGSLRRVCPPMVISHTNG